MRSTLTSLFLAALLVQGTAAVAQDTSTPPADDPAAETEDPATDAPQPDDASSDPASGLSTGEPVGPQVGQPYDKEQFVDWTVRCIKAPEGQQDPCNLYQLLRDDSGAAVSEVNIFKLPEGSRAAAGATIVVPLETLLTQQLTLSVDGANQRRYPFTFCNPAGCVARVGFTQAEVDQFKRGNAGTIRLVPAAAPSDEFNLRMSLSGFTAGFDSLPVRN